MASFLNAAAGFFRPVTNVLKRVNGYLEWAFPDSPQVSPPSFHHSDQRASLPRSKHPSL